MKTRLLLGGFALLMLSAFLLGLLYFGHTHWFSQSQVNVSGTIMTFLLILPPLPFLSALIMLIFSLFKVETRPDGSLTYDPANPYWRVMRKAFKEDFSANISVCKACWLTALFLLGSLAVLMVVFLLSFMIWLYMQGEFLNHPFNWRGVVPILFGMFSFFLPVWLARWLIDLGTEKQNRFLKILGDWIMRVWEISFLVVIPISALTSKFGFWSGTLTYLKWAGGIVAIFLSIFGLVYLAFWLGEKTLLGQWVKAFKEDFCPLLNPVSKEAKS